jgi:hypothetical protein
VLYNHQNLQFGALFGKMKKRGWEAKSKVDSCRASHRSERKRKEIS